MKFVTSMGDNHVCNSARVAVALMVRETTGATMQPCRTMKVYDTRRKRINQVVNRNTRGLV